MIRQSVFQHRQHVRTLLAHGRDSPSFQIFFLRLHTQHVLLLNTLILTRACW